MLVRNVSTGQSLKLEEPYNVAVLSKIGVDENFQHQVYVQSGYDSFGFGTDGYMYFYELKAFIKSIENRKNPYHFEYMMLDRLRQDCDYFLGYGNRCVNVLWAESVEKQIAEMKRIWEVFPDDLKPQWLTWEEILQYERRMMYDN
ncbi:TPA: hypothetical protein U1C81_000552 [Streptococcus suis]|nr:hypothetical protein [Streptococcus suis]HEM3666820.1 hypothetical protein [Streptococcus suis]